LDCPSGHYCNSDIKYPCPRGTFNQFDGRDELTDCFPCPSDTYSDNGEAICAICPVPDEYGSYSISYDVSTKFFIFDQCGSCYPGTFRASNGSCIPCTVFEDPTCYSCGKEEGTYCPYGTNEPIDCPVGYWCNYWNDVPYKCPNGKTTNGTSNSTNDCFDCPAGTREINGICTQCPPGTFSGSGQNVCNQCPIGYYSDAGSTVSTDCVPCQAGTHEVNRVCTQCPRGTYSSVGQNVCNQCPAGYYSETGSTNCTACPAGTFESERYCGNCSVGCVSEEGSIECTECPNEKIGSGEECIHCPSDQRGIDHVCITGKRYPFNWKYRDLVCIEDDEREICQVIANLS
jgi:syndecan 4